MKPHLRLQLPPLAELTPSTPLAFVQVGRDGRALREGKLGAQPLAALAGSWPVHAIVHAGDAVVARLTVPPVVARRLSEAVRSSIEPMVLSELDHLLVAHGPREANGMVDVAWAERQPLEAAWALLVAAGLNVISLVPQALALPPQDPRPEDPLDLPVGPRWLAPLPTWSLAERARRPAGDTRRWRHAVLWGGVACAVWILGLNIEAARQHERLEGLQQSMRQTVQQAYPQIPVVIDPVRQARQQRDAQRRAGGSVAADDFIPLALAAASVLDFAQGRVLGVHYENNQLRLTLAEGHQPPVDETALAQSAAAQRIQLEHDTAQPHIWHVRRLEATDSVGQPTGGAR